MNRNKQKLANCTLEPKKYGKLSNDELAILEGLIFPYSDFGGVNLINNPEKIVQALNSDLRQELYNVLRDDSKTHQSSKLITYQHEKEVFEYYSFHEYDQEAANLLKGFNTLHNLALKEEENLKILLELNRNLHDKIISYIEDSENLTKIIDYYQSKDESLGEAKVKLKFYRDVKYQMENLDIDKIDLVFPDNKVKGLLEGNFSEVII